jgi:uncharacterized protein with HEPN domain
MRDKLIHKYFAVDIHLVWYTAKENIPDLVKELEQILQELEGEEF